MSEENKQNPETETPEIVVPSTPAPDNSDIVAAKPEAGARQSAVIGQVDRPAAAPARGGRGGQRGGQRGNQRGGQRLSLIHISEPTRQDTRSRLPS